MTVNANKPEHQEERGAERLDTGKGNYLNFTSYIDRI
jgi:hypothetical protein